VAAHDRTNKNYQKGNHMQWFLKSMAETGKEWTIEIASAPFVIGRSDDCDLKLADRRISRHHSEIRMSGDLLWIRDLNSTNGTYVNQNKIENALLLEPNYTISIGKYRFKIQANSSSSAVNEYDTIHATLSENLNEIDIEYYEPKFRELIHKRSVIPNFQPIIKFSNMEVVGFEILGRIKNNGLPSNPAKLLDMAETLGYGSELSSLFREAGVEIAGRLPGTPLLFVNSSKFEIYDIESLILSMKRIKEISNSNKIILEINEKAATHTNDLILLRNDLEKMNMGLAFDDFGVGQTRLLELSKTPPDYLKFDISLIRKIHLAPKRVHQMISTFIKASHDLGVITLAEGIECSEESKVCKKLGFDLGQGFFFGKPAPFNEIMNKNQSSIGIQCQIEEYIEIEDLNKTFRLQ
jgi:EAL domain-containing protein (putative c-di-GMP-specific phosphodiesterase class I)